MQTVATTLLLILPEDPAFRLLDHIHRHLLARTLSPSLLNLCLDTAVTRDILSNQLPTLVVSDQSIDVPFTNLLQLVALILQIHFANIKYHDPSLLISQWLAILGLTVFPSDLSCRVLDLVLYEGVVLTVTPDRYIPPTSLPSLVTNRDHISAYFAPFLHIVKKK